MNHQETPWLSRPPNQRGRWGSIVVVLLLAGLGVPSVNAMEPLYVGLSVGIQELDVDHTKSVGLAVAPDTKNRASMLASRDSARDRFGVLRMVVGYRAFLAESAYLAC